MTQLQESNIEELAIEKLKELGFTYRYGPNLAPDGQYPARHSYEDVVLKDKLFEAIQRLNPDLPYEAQQDALKEVLRVDSPDLTANNENFHTMLTEGVKITHRKDGQQRGDLAWLVDFNNPENNEFLVVNQFTILENGKDKRPDVILFVNGLPLVVIELKNAVNEKTTTEMAYQQLQTYKRVIPSLFNYNSIMVASDGFDANAGTVTSNFEWFMKWKSSDGETVASTTTSELETLIDGMLNKDTLLDLIRHFIVFEKTKKDLESGQITVKTEKKLASYHQYYAVNKAVESTLRASGYESNNSKSKIVSEAPQRYGLEDVKEQPPGDRKGGVVWHTQGSGKSLSMVFYTGKIVLALDNPTIVVITDRNDLDDQLYDTFASSKQLLRQEPKQAEGRDDLKENLKVASGGIVFTTIQKFQPTEGNVFDKLSDRENIIVIADEAHRTQYGFKAKTIDVKDDNGEVIGSRVTYGFAKYMRDALPNATYLGFTGTPIEKQDVNTPAVFGNYIDIYDIAQAVEDGATVPIYYESRLAKIKLTEEGKELVEELDKELEEDDLSTTQQAKAKWTKLEALVGSNDRLNTVANDIVTHYEARETANNGKAMIVTMSRRIAAELYDKIIKLRPTWHSDELKKGAIKVVMTSSSSDKEIISKHHTTKRDRKTLANRMKDPEDELKLVIVCDMWLTGFDVPCLHTMYLDKPIKGHNLMQAIARINRKYNDKKGGLVVDYLGIASDLKKALRFYADAGGKGDPAIQQERAVELMLEKLEIVSQMFNGFPYERYFDADVSNKLTIILEAQEHILGIEDGKKRFIDEVARLSQAFSIAVPHEQAMDIKDEVAFFQAVKSRLVKFTQNNSSKSNVEIETAIRQVVDQALVSNQVIDVFDAAGIKKPDIDILSEEFLEELKGMKHKNLAIEVLKKLLTDEINARSRINLIKSKTLQEMLEEAIKKYHNKVLTSAEVIDALIHLGTDIVEMDKEADELGLSAYEYAFYSAVANNDSARELMKKDKLRELAVVLTEEIRNKASIDWTKKESVKASLRVAVKRLLRKYGYPPDMQKLATDNVLKQAEKLAYEITMS